MQCSKGKHPAGGSSRSAATQPREEAIPDRLYEAGASLNSGLAENRQPRKSPRLALEGIRLWIR